jgi:2'-5' RNA ligase
MMHNLFIAHFIDPMPDGTRVQMGKWPTHLTLLSNFFTEQPLEEVLRQLGELAHSLPAAEIRLVAEELFGENRDMRVLLAEPNRQLLDLHFNLADFAERVGTLFTRDYTYFDYRPHITVQPNTQVQLGDTRTLDRFTVFDYDALADKRSALATFTLG